MNSVRVLIIVLSIIAFSSCSKGDYFGEYHDINSEGWHIDSLQSFEVTFEEDDLESMDIDLSIRNFGSYAYSNLWLFVNTSTPSGKTFTDTLECTLAEPSGRWIGTGTGSIYHNTFKLKHNYQFNKIGTYKFSIQHGMRAEFLEGISDVGIRIAKKEDGQE